MKLVELRTNFLPTMFAKVFAVAAVAVAVFTSGTSAEFEACNNQDAFDIIMCNSHACNDCELQWCMKHCQSTQQAYPTCRCADWPESRVSYSGGDFKGKGKLSGVNYGF